MRRLSGHLDTLQHFVIDKLDCLGCKKSWVQIPPRRPIISCTYLSFGEWCDFAISPNSPQETVAGRGTNSGQKNYTANADFELNYGANQLAPDSHCTNILSKINFGQQERRQVVTATELASPNSSSPLNPRKRLCTHSRGLSQKCYLRKDAGARLIKEPFAFPCKKCSQQKDFA